MSESSAQNEVIQWITDDWLTRTHGQTFSTKKVQLSCGGEFKFNAVSNDGTMIGCITTSQLKTASGKNGIGKIHKTRSDLYFLLLTRAERKLLICTESCMYDYWIAEQTERQRVPKAIEFVLLELPDSLRKRLEIARKIASDEVTPIE